jgi:hypothetical protein
MRYFWRRSGCGRRIEGGTDISVGEPWATSSLTGYGVRRSVPGAACWTGAERGGGRRAAGAGGFARLGVALDQCIFAVAGRASVSSRVCLRRSRDARDGCYKPNANQIAGAVPSERSGLTNILMRAGDLSSLHVIPASGRIPADSARKLSAVFPHRAAPRRGGLPRTS